jgi:hypothetical protein
MSLANHKIQNVSCERPRPASEQPEATLQKLGGMTHISLLGDICVNGRIASFVTLSAGRGTAQVLAQLHGHRPAGAGKIDLNVLIRSGSLQRSAAR